MAKESTRINNQILAKELRVIGADGSNLGVLKKEEALAQAENAGLDLIEVTSKTVPPIAKIMDYGKFQYEQKKKERKQKAGGKKTETKSVQIKIGTGDHDLGLKAKRVDEFLGEGHRVKIDLFLAGRAKYLDKNFLHSRLERFLKIITIDHKVADGPQKSPKGITVIIEKALGTK